MLLNSTLVVRFDGARNRSVPRFWGVRTALLSIIVPRSSDIRPRPHQHPQTVPQLHRHCVRQGEEFIPCSFGRLRGCWVPDSVDDRAQSEVNDIRRCLRLEGIVVLFRFVRSKDTRGRSGRVCSRERMLVRDRDKDPTGHNDDQVEK